MPQYIVLTRLMPALPVRNGDLREDRLRETAHRISLAVGRNVPEARWLESFALLGRYDFLDVFDLPGHEHAQRLEMTIREAGPADAEVLPAAVVMRDIEGNLLGTSYRRAALDRNDDVRQASEESFPASDAPAWR